MRLSHVLLFITAAVTDRKRTTSDTICAVQNRFPVESYCSFPGPTTASSSGQPYRLLLRTLSSCFVFVNVLSYFPYLFSASESASTGVGLFLSVSQAIGFSSFLLPRFLHLLTGYIVLSVVSLYGIVL